MFVLDTNVVSELRKVRSGKANPGVTEWVADVPSAQMFLSLITIHELEHGVLLLERSDPGQGAVLRTWLDESVAALHVPDPSPFRDALIGATALVGGMATVARNVKGFERFEGIDVLNPWT